MCVFTREWLNERVNEWIRKINTSEWVWVKVCIYERVWKHMNVYTRGRESKWMNEWMCVHTRKWMNERIYACMRVNRWMYICTRVNRWMYIYTREWMDEWMNGCVCIGKSQWVNEWMNTYNKYEWMNMCKIT